MMKESVIMEVLTLMNTKTMELFMTILLLQFTMEISVEVDIEIPDIVPEVNQFTTLSTLMDINLNSQNLFLYIL